MEPETIVACPCGANVRVPPGNGARRVRCPVCKAPLTLNSESRATNQPEPSQAQTAGTCPICQSEISRGDSVIRCPQCDQIHHQECWSEVGGCGTYGCTQAPIVVPKPSIVPTTAWGDNKQCPVCGEKIKSIAVRCRYCKTDFGTAEPLTRQDFYHQNLEATGRGKLRAHTLILFVLSLLGCTAPIAGLIASAYLLPKQQQLWKSGPLYVVLCWATLIISGLFTVMISLFVIFETK